MSPSLAHSQPLPKSAHRTLTTHVHALADPLPFGMQDASLRPVGCSGLAFRELIQPNLTARAPWTWPDIVKRNGRP